MISSNHIQELANLYEIPPAEVSLYFSVATEQAASEAFKMPLFLQEDGSLCGYGKTIENYELTKKVVRHITHKVEDALLDVSIQRKFEAAIRLENKMVWGMPSYKEDKIIIHTQIGFVGFSKSAHLPQKERGAYKLGGKKAWYVESASREDKRSLILNRTSIKLPELLINYLNTEVGIFTSVKCIKRVPGVYCMIKTSRPLDPRVIEAASKELGEKIKTYISKGEKQ